MLLLDTALLDNANAGIQVNVIYVHREATTKIARFMVPT